MKKIVCFLFSFFTLSIASFAGYIGIGKIQVLPIENSPVNDAIILEILYPLNNGFERRFPIRSQIRLESFSLGVMSRIYQPLSKLQNDPDGQTVHVIIDDLPFFKVTVNNEDSSNANFSLYRRMLSFEIPYRLTPGKHIMRAFPVFSYGESIKLQRAFDVHEFYYRSKANDIQFDITKPFLTYNLPQGKYVIGQSDPILLDFLVTNASLTPDGYKALLSIDEKMVLKIDEVRPYLIYGLEEGEHMIELELISSSGARVENSFNPIRRKISVRYQNKK